MGQEAMSEANDAMLATARRVAMRAGGEIGSTPRAAGALMFAGCRIAHRKAKQGQVELVHADLLGIVDWALERAPVHGELQFWGEEDDARFRDEVNRAIVLLLEECAGETALSAACALVAGVLIARFNGAPDVLVRDLFEECWKRQLERAKEPT